MLFDFYTLLNNLIAERNRNCLGTYRNLNLKPNATIFVFMIPDHDDLPFCSRIFIKILFQSITEYLGIPKLNSRIRDP